jgi:hypothetical protein
METFFVIMIVFSFITLIVGGVFDRARNVFKKHNIPVIFKYYRSVTIFEFIYWIIKIKDRKIRRELRKQLFFVTMQLVGLISCILGVYLLSEL